MTRPDAIGFDLDMTLVDSRPVSQRALERLVSEYGADLNIEKLMSAYGLPLSRWLPTDIDGALFRTLQVQDIGLAVPMPGAHEALAAVRGAAAATIVVTSAPLAIAARILQARAAQNCRVGRSGPEGNALPSRRTMAPSSWACARGDA
jgi:phosphoglycolate phosphatase